MCHEIRRLLISGFARLGFYAVQSFGAVGLAAFLTNIERLRIIGVPALIVHQVVHMLGEVLAAVVRVNDIGF